MGTMAITLILNSTVMTNMPFMDAPKSRFKESSKSLRRKQQPCLEMLMETGYSYYDAKYQEITYGSVNNILDTVRPFLDLADGTVDCVDIIIRTSNGSPPCIELLIMGKVVMLKGIKERISEKIKPHFMIPGLRIEYEKGDYDEFVDRLYA